MWSLLQRTTSGCWVLHGVEDTQMDKTTIFIVACLKKYKMSTKTIRWSASRICNSKSRISTVNINCTSFYKQYFSIKMIFIFFHYIQWFCLSGEESCAFVWGLFSFVLHLCDAGAELHGSLGQDGWLAEAELLRRQSQEEFLPDASREWQICFVPHGKRVQVAHHVLVQVGKSAVKSWISSRLMWRWKDVHLSLDIL